MRTIFYCSALLLASAQTPAAERFSGMLADGTRISGDKATPWFATDSQPRLGKHLLLDAKNHVRWLRDNTLKLPTPPDAFVEFFGGDRLPGRVFGFRSGNESPLDRRPPHLLVDHLAVHDWPPIPRESIRIDLRWLRRIVWRRRTDGRYRPGTMFSRDGSRIKFRSLRFGPSGVRLLLEDGTRDVPYSRMAELHLPRQDAWDLYYKQLALLLPEGRGRLMRLETIDGLKVTSSSERFQAIAYGAHTVDRWYHMVQPAWSFDPLWMRHRTIQLRRYSLPHRVPLSDVEIAGSSVSSEYSGHWAWRRDRNVLGGLLRSGGDDFGWGIGVHAMSKLQLKLPRSARFFHTKIGLDQIVGRGGCARALIEAGEGSGRSQYRSELLIGAETVLSPAPLRLPPPGNPASASGQRILTLVADPAHADRPQGADPLNIRDLVNWLEPEIELDAKALRREVRRRAVSLIPAWQDWTVNPSGDPASAGLQPAEPVVLFSRWDESERKAPRYRTEVVPRLPLLILSRSMKLTPADRWLALAVSRHPQGTAPTKIEIRVNGKLLGRFLAPLRAPGVGEPEPLTVSLIEFSGQQVKIELMPLPMGPDARLDWRGIAVLKHRPGLLPLFDEQVDILKQLKIGEGIAEIESEDRHTGVKCLKIASADKTAPRLPGLPATIRQRPRLGEFRYLRFAWKKKGGHHICLQLGHDGRFGLEDEDSKASKESFRYDSGGGGLSYGSAIRITGRVPADWVVITRDLYADFGEFSLTGLSFGAIDGEYALFDHIYLGRTLNDFQKIEVSAAGSGKN